jgi:hypothetical protein
MAGVTAIAWRPFASLAYVPGVMSLLSDTPPGSSTWTRYRPLPLAAGPICDPCWMARKVVTAVGRSQCPHGGAR